MIGYKKHHAGLKTRMMWFNGRRYVVSGIDHYRHFTYTYATVQTENDMHFSDTFVKGHSFSS